MSSKVRPGKNRRDRRGNAAVVALSALAMLGFASLTVDIGNARMIQAQLHNTLDAATQAAVGYIPSQPGEAANMTSTWPADGKAAAIAVAFENYANGRVVLTEQQVEWGYYADTTSDNVTNPTFTVKDPGDATQRAQINAVRVVRTLTNIDTMLGLAAFGIGQIGAGARSISLASPPEGATRTPCFLPLAIPDCRLANPESAYGDYVGNINFSMSSANGDNAAWAMPGSANPSASAINAYMGNGSCSAENQDWNGATGSPVVSLNTGQIASSFQTLSGLLNGGELSDESTLPAWDDYGDLNDGLDDDFGQLPAHRGDSEITNASYGMHVMAGPVAMFRPPNSETYCADADRDGIPDGGSFNQDDLEVTGVVWAVVYDVTFERGDRDVVVRLFPDVPAEATDGGGSYTGGITIPQPPTIVQ